MKNKGELTTQQIVTIIILIASFVVILFLLFRLNFGEETNKEICHNSVVMLGKKGGLFTSLDCKTTYICISGGGDCDFSYDSKQEISLGETVINETKEYIQTEMKDCDWMFGEGKINYVGSVDLPGYRCAICSTIKFDEKIQEQFETIKFDETVLVTSEKYSIVVGMDPTLPFVKDNFIPVTIIKTDEINSLNCKEFITKA